MSRYENGAYYDLEIVDHAFTETSTGKAQIEFDCKVLRKVKAHGTPEVHFVPAEQSQYTVRVRIVFGSEKQRELNLKKLRFAGWEGSSFDDFDMVGKVIRCACEHSSGTGSNSGKVYDNFDLLLPPREGSGELEDKADVKKKLNALLGKALKETAAPATFSRPGQSFGQTPPASHSGRPVSNDDDTPIF
jgi:hypothetical protein